MSKRTLFKPRTRCVGAVYLEPRRIRWVSGNIDRNGLMGDLTWGEVPLDTGGAVTEYPSLDEIMREVPDANGTRWSVIVPTPARARVLETPTMSDQDLEKGLAWQTEIHFPPQEGDWTVDHEVLDSTSAKAESQSVLLLGIERARLTPWVDWARNSDLNLNSLTAPFPALLRGVRHAWSDATDSRVLVYEDSHLAALVVAVRGKLVHWRSLSEKSKTARVPLSRDEGVSRVRESLLYCEDRYPDVSFRFLYGGGDLSSDWLQEVAESVDLEVGTWPTPESTRPNAPEWLIPLGELIGG